MTVGPIRSVGASDSGRAVAAVLVAITVLAGPAACRPQPVATAPTVRHIVTPLTADLGLPFAEAVRVGDMLYLSGMIGLRPGTMEVVAGGLEAETRQTMDNIRAMLEAGGSSLDRVVRCLVMLDDMAEWPRFNAIWVEYFPRNPPARSALGADGLALGARVEVECTATVGDARSAAGRR